VVNVENYVWISMMSAISISKRPLSVRTRIDVRVRTGDNKHYLLNDHLTSTAITTNSSGARQTELRYFAYGGTRYDAGGQMTIYR